MIAKDKTCDASKNYNLESGIWNNYQQAHR